MEATGIPASEITEPKLATGEIFTSSYPAPGAFATRSAYTLLAVAAKWMGLRANEGGAKGALAALLEGGEAGCIAQLRALRDAWPTLTDDDELTFDGLLALVIVPVVQQRARSLGWFLDSRGFKRALGDDIDRIGGYVAASLGRAFRVEAARRGVSHSTLITELVEKGLAKAASK
jgi:hypothetical protein